ncbi:MAG: hypothetical protein JWP81_4491 [Ferruginibacter sp.]|nr:hypothetical protein [Ferruginibacter sp.]
MKLKHLCSTLVVLTVLISSPTIAQNVGIGTFFPQTRLHVNGTSWFQGDNTPLPSGAGNGIAIGFGPGAAAGYIFGFNYSSFTPRNIWLQSPGGNVIIGSLSTAPQARVDITSTGSRALYATTNSGEALYGNSTGGHAIVGVSASALGVYAISQVNGGAGLLSEGVFIGLQGTAKGTDVNRQGVRGEVSTGTGGGYAGIFVGGTTLVSGTLQKSAGSFIIDHPLAPETKYLIHSFVESPDMKNIYDGLVTTDGGGFAIVTMPDWFDALNTDFRYQLTCIGQFAQAIISQEITGRQFIIQTDKPLVKVSWQVTGIRNDPYARDKRLPVEKLKRADEIGKYIYPEGYGKGAESLLDILKPTHFGDTLLMKPQK